MALCHELIFIVKTVCCLLMQTASKLLSELFESTVSYPKRLLLLMLMIVETAE